MADGGHGEARSTGRIRFGLGTYLLAIGILAPVLVAWAWPAVAGTPGSPAAVVDGNVSANATYVLQAWPSERAVTLPGPTLTILLVLLGGFVGAWLHASIHFVYHVGRDTFSAKWAWWCVLLPWTGAMLAAGTFVAFHGLAALVEPAVSLNVPLPPAAPFGLAFITGLFSRKATLWLEDQASRLFGTTKDRDKGRGGAEARPPDGSGGPTAVPVKEGTNGNAAGRVQEHP